jgi:hypothetical protein
VTTTAKSGTAKTTKSASSPKHGSVGKSTGNSYRQEENNLPTSVTP